MSSLSEIQAAAEALPREQKEELLVFLAAKLGRGIQGTISQAQTSERRPGLHPGVWEVAADFGAPLSNEFWLGRDA